MPVDDGFLNYDLYEGSDRVALRQKIKLREMVVRAYLAHWSTRPHTQFLPHK